jgi:hypothetical protein
VEQKQMYYIMNAKALFGGKVTLERVMMEMGDSESINTILVCRREKGIGEWKPIFVSGAGKGYATEQSAASYTEDTGMGHRNKGKDLQIDNVITYMNGHIVSKLNDIGVDEKRSCWVMK